MLEPMADMKVFIAYQMSRFHLAQIRNISPSLDLTYKPCQVPEDMVPYLADVEVLHTHHASFDPGVAPRLKWIQVTGAGIDYLQGQPIMKSDVIITNARIFGTPIAEYVFGSMLSFSRNFPQMLPGFQKEREWPEDPWKMHVGRELHNSTLGIVGYGDIGRAVARIGRGFGMRVVATRGTASKPYQQDDVQILPAHYLKDLLAMSDFVVICVPLAPETEGLIGHEELKAMKPNAYLVNIARGKVIDETALITALREGWIAGAGLDVFAEEPLPRDSELFDLPNVILTPHIAGISTGYGDRITDLFCENLRRYLKGEPLLNVVDKERGY